MGTLQGSVATANGVLQGARADPAGRSGRGRDLPDRPGPADRGVAERPRRRGSRPSGGAGRAVRDAAGDRGGITAAGQTVTTLAQQAGAANTVLQTTSSALGLLRQGIGEVAGVAGYIAAARPRRAAGRPVGVLRRLDQRHPRRGRHPGRGGRLPGQPSRPCTCPTTSTTWSRAPRHWRRRWCRACRSDPSARPGAGPTP